MNNERLAFVSNAYTERYGAPPTVWTRAPGRVDLMGSHTDYNMGFVLTMTIDRDTWIAARPRSDRKVAISSLNIEGASEFELDRITYDEKTPWTNYVRGVAQALQESGYELKGFDGLVHSTVPFGSGLSSSAAIEMATAMMFKTLADLDLDPIQMALLGQKAENHFVGINSGILDQYSSAMGREGCALLLDCRELSSETMQLPEELRLVICDTQSKRELTGSEYGERRAQCEEGTRILAGFYPDVTALRDVSLAQFEAHEQDLPVVVAKRCRFVIEENQRVLDMAAALAHDDRAAMQRLMDASYAGARDLYEIATAEMEAMMKAMRSGPGVVGARQAGAGFGGCMVALVQRQHVDAFAEHVRTDYASATGITPKVYPVRAAPGAGALKIT